MPTVPRIDGPTVEAKIPEPKTFNFGAPQAHNFAVEQGRQTNEAMAQISDLAARAAIDAQTQQNQLRVDDALNQAKELSFRMSYDKDVGFTNLNGRSRKSNGRRAICSNAESLVGHGR